MQIRTKVKENAKTLEEEAKVDRLKPLYLVLGLKLAFSQTTKKAARDAMEALGGNIRFTIIAYVLLFMLHLIINYICREHGGTAS